MTRQIRVQCVLVALVISAAPGGKGATTEREAARLRRHFDVVGAELRSRDTSHLTNDERLRRAEAIAWLVDYRDAGLFPENLHYPVGPVPIFRDDRGVLCAMAYLIARSGDVGYVERVSRTKNTAYISELAGDSHLLRWLEETGLTVAEAARIQPSYPCGGQCATPPPEKGVSQGFAAASVSTAALSVTTFIRSVKLPARERGWQAVFAGGLQALVGLSGVDTGGATAKLGWSDVAIGGLTVGAGIRAIMRAKDSAAPTNGRKDIDVVLLLPFERPDYGRRFGAQVRVAFQHW